MFTHFAFTFDPFTAMATPPAPEHHLAKAAQFITAAHAVSLDQLKRGAGLTPMQIAWAREHDWYLIPTTQAGKTGVIVRDEATCEHAPGDVQELMTTREYFDFEDLRAFAGY